MHHTLKVLLWMVNFSKNQKKSSRVWLNFYVLLLRFCKASSYLCKKALPLSLKTFFSSSYFNGLVGFFRLLWETFVWFLLVFSTTSFDKRPIRPVYQSWQKSGSFIYKMTTKKDFFFLFLMNNSHHNKHQARNLMEK